MSSPTPASDLILDVHVSLSLEIGRTHITIRDLLKLAPGSVVELDRPAGYDALATRVRTRLPAMS